ncbi:MAG: SAM-dependent methyltransferase [Planctomycetota bacterium]|jgi:SAM-dependent methyltransferase
MTILAYVKNQTPARPLLVQSHWSDFDSFGDLVTDTDVGLIAKAQRAFEDVVLVCGEDSRNACVHEFAEQAGIKSFAGDDRDVGLRMSACMESFGWTRAARALAHHFTVDLDSVTRAFELMEREESQYVMLPKAFDLRFGCDVFSAEFLDEARKVTEAAAPSHKRRLTHTPWAAAELAPERFKLSHFTDVPAWGIERFHEIRATTNALYPENSRKASMPLPGYEQALELLSPGVERALDVACGWGDGTAFLAKHIASATGADYDAEQISLNRNDHPAAHFVSGDATDTNLFEPNLFDAIVSIHSMEHFQDDRAFLRAVSHWLKPGGQFVLEVPLVMDSPFPGIDIPLGEGHVREYRVAELIDLVGELFQVDLAFGVSRGLYLEVDRARNAVMLALTSK